MTRTFLLREGTDEAEGAGALRRFAVGPFGSVEEVLVWDPPSHLAYTTRRGLPVRAYRADVVLREENGVTVVEWRGSLEPKLPGSGRIVLAFVRTLVAGFVKRLCRYADEQAGTKR